jgi:deoxyribonuclease V
MVLVDGQGLAHPRRFGIACHLGLFLGIPAIGCAKSRLVGSHAEPGPNPGEYALLKDNGEVIGAALRTRAGTKPVYVSIGHRISLNMSIKWVMRCLGGYRLPEPARLAHQAAGGNLQLIKSVCTR